MPIVWHHQRKHFVCLGNQLGAVVTKIKMKFEYIFFYQIKRKVI